MKDLNYYYQQSKELAGEKNYTELKKLSIEGLSHYKNNTRLLNYLTGANLQLGNYSKSISLGEKTLSIMNSESSPDAEIKNKILKNLAKSYYKFAEDNPSHVAIECYKKALIKIDQLSPEYKTRDITIINTDCKKEIVKLRLRRDNFEKIQNSLKEDLEGNDNNYFSRNKLSTNYYKMAIEIYKSIEGNFLNFRESLDNCIHQLKEAHRANRGDVFISDLLANLHYKRARVYHQAFENEYKDEDNLFESAILSYKKISGIPTYKSNDEIAQLYISRGVQLNSKAPRKYNQETLSVLFNNISASDKKDIFDIIEKKINSPKYHLRNKIKNLFPYRRNNLRLIQPLFDIRRDSNATFYRLTSNNLTRNQKNMLVGILKNYYITKSRDSFTSAMEYDPNIPTANFERSKTRRILGRIFDKFQGFWKSNHDVANPKSWTQRFFSGLGYASLAVGVAGIIAGSVVNPVLGAMLFGGGATILVGGSLTAFFQATSMNNKSNREIEIDKQTTKFKKIKHLEETLVEHFVFLKKDISFLPDNNKQVQDVLNEIKKQEEILDHTKTLISNVEKTLDTDFINNPEDIRLLNQSHDSITSKLFDCDNNLRNLSITTDDITRDLIELYKSNLGSERAKEIDKELEQCPEGMEFKKVKELTQEVDTPRSNRISRPKSDSTTPTRKTIRLNGTDINIL